MHFVDNSGFDFKLEQWQVDTAAVALESTPVAVEAALRVYVNTYRDYGASGEDAKEHGIACLMDFVSHCLAEKAKAPVQVSHAAPVPAAQLSAGVASSPDADVRFATPTSCVKLELPVRAAAARDALDHASQIIMTPEHAPPAQPPKVEAPSPSASNMSAGGAGIEALLAELRSRPDADPTCSDKPMSDKQRSFMKQLNVLAVLIDRCPNSAWASIIIEEQLGRKKAGKAALAIDTRNPQ